MISLDSIASAAFAFAFMFSILITIIALAYLSSGIEVPKEIETLMLPTSYFINVTRSIVSQYPSSPTAGVIAWTKVAIAAVTALLQFLYTLLTGFINIVIVISKIVPPSCAYLLPPLYFIGAFLQFTLWYYVTKKILSLVGVSVGV